MIKIRTLSVFLKITYVLTLASATSAGVFGQTEHWELYLEGPSAQSGEVWRLAGSDTTIYAYGNFEGGSLAKISASGMLQTITKIPMYIEAMTIYNEKLYVAGSPETKQVPGLTVMDQTGNVIWNHQEATPGHYSGVHVDASGVYVNGYGYVYPETIFMRKFDHSGNLLWSTDLNVGAAFNSGPMVVQSDRIYLKAGLNNLAVLDTNGEFVNNIATSGDIISLFYADNFLYASGVLRDPTNSNQTIGNNLVKMNMAGDQIWEKVFHSLPNNGDSTQGLVGQILIDSGSILLSMKDAPSPSNSFIAKFDLNGAKLSEEALRNLNRNLPAPPMIHATDNLIVAGEKNELAFVGTVVPDQPDEYLPINRAISVGDINADGFQNIALLASGVYDAPALVSIRTIKSSLEILSEFPMDSINDITDLQVVPDTNKNGAPELLVLGGSSLHIELHDSESGQLLRKTHTGADFNAFKVTPINNLPKGDPTLYGVFGQRASGGWPHVKLLSADTLEQLSTISFHPEFTARDFTVIDDINGDQIPELAMLGTNLATQQSKIEIRSLADELINNIWLGKTFDAQSFVLPATASSGYTVTPGEIAVLQSKRKGNGKRIAVINATSGVIDRVIGFNWQYDSSRALALEDYNGNNFSEFAILGKRILPNNADNRPVKVEIRDSTTAGLIANIWQVSHGSLTDFDILPDINGNASPEIVTLIDNNGTVTAYIKDSLNGDVIATFPL